jgi:F-type H+-transporting ATPase subunit epsilon
MAGTFKFELVSPEKVLMSADIEQVMLPATEGDMTVMTNHAPVVVNLRPGIIDVGLPGSKSRLYVKSGIAEIVPDRVTVLASSAFDIADADAGSIASELSAAEAALAAATGDEEKAFAYRAVEQLKSLGGRAA